MPGLAALLAALLAPPSLALAAGEAQIFKCIDASGNVTYQNEPCPREAKSGRIEIFDNRWTATREEREAEWRRNASEHRLATGMPARWVREALGEPTEIRDAPTAGAAQLWLYTLSDRSVQVGMLNDQVLWFRETPTSASPAARVAPPAERTGTEAPQVSRSTAAAPARPADLPVMRMVPSETDRVADTRPPPPAERAASEPRSAEPSPTPTAAAPPGSPAKNPRAVARGQDCKQVLADLGVPDRQRDVPAIDAGSDPATEYFYDSAAAGRLRIVCANGKVEGVDRSVAR